MWLECGEKPLKCHCRKTQMCATQNIKSDEYEPDISTIRLGMITTLSFFNFATCVGCIKQVGMDTWQMKGVYSFTKHTHNLSNTCLKLQRN